MTTSAPTLSRRHFFATGTAALLCATLLTSLSQPSFANSTSERTSTTVSANGVDLHVIEQGSGEPVLFLHGFPDTAETWSRQMDAVAEAGYRAIALDMRGYGQSSTPTAVEDYSTFHIVGDVVAVLDALEIPSAVLVGHDWGAGTAWNAAILRPDRVSAVFGLSVPFAPRGELSLGDMVRSQGIHDFYMFDLMQAEADATYANAAFAIPSILYWTSGSTPEKDRWNPFDQNFGVLRPLPENLPDWLDRDYLEHNIEAFDRTGFRGGLNYYRSMQMSHDMMTPFKNQLVEQPSFVLYGAADGLNRLTNPSDEAFRQVLPNLRGSLAVPGVGHWPQHEASEVVSEALIGFLDQL